MFGDITRSRDVPDFIDLTRTSLLDTTFVPLEAQRAWTCEIGSRGRAGRLAGDVKLYRCELRDALVSFSVDPRLRLPAATFNAPRSRPHNVEAAALFAVSHRLTAIGNRLMLTQLGGLFTKRPFPGQGTSVHPRGRRAGLDRRFDVGYSPLAALAEITADELKIDRSFITDIHKRLRGQIVLKAIKLLGQALGTTIIAEGASPSSRSPIYERRR